MMPPSHCWKGGGCSVTVCQCFIGFESAGELGTIGVLKSNNMFKIVFQFVTRDCVLAAATMQSRVTNQQIFSLLSLA